MAKNKKARIPHKFLPWIAIRKQYNLTHAEVQMARELGLEPRRFPSYANIKDQPWKKPLKEFIAELYLKQTGREQPETVFSMEDLAAQHVARRLAKKQAKLERLASEAGEEDSSESVWPGAESEAAASEAGEAESPAAGETMAEPAAEAAPPEAVPEPVESEPESVAAEPIPAEPEPESPVVEAVVADPEPIPEPEPVAEPEPISEPEPVAETPEPEPESPEEAPQPEAPPAAPLSPWEAARARLNAKSKGESD